jgi:hypothetical protein
MSGISGSLGVEYEDFWDVAPCSPVKFTDFSEVFTASIIALMMEAISTSDPTF